MAQITGGRIWVTSNRCFLLKMIVRPEKDYKKSGYGKTVPMTLRSVTLRLSQLIAVESREQEARCGLGDIRFLSSFGYL